MLLEEGTLTSAHVVVVSAVRRRHRAVSKPQNLSVKIRVGACVCSVSRVIKAEVLVIGTIPRPDANLIQAIFPLLNHEVVLKDVDALEKHIIPVCNHLFPVVFCCGAYRSAHQTEILGVQIGHDVEVVPVMADAIFQIALTGLNDTPFTHGIIRSEHPVFLRQRL